MVIKQEPKGKKRLCSALVMQGCERREGKWWDLRHCWHDTADDQQNGLIEEGGEISSCPGFPAAKSRLCCRRA